MFHPDNARPNIICISIATRYIYGFYLFLCITNAIFFVKILPQKKLEKIDYSSFLHTGTKAFIVNCLKNDEKLRMEDGDILPYSLELGQRKLFQFSGKLERKKIWKERKVRMKFIGSKVLMTDLIQY